MGRTGGHAHPGDVVFDDVGHHRHARAGAHAAGESPDLLLLVKLLGDGLGAVGVVAVVAQEILDLAAVDAALGVDEVKVDPGAPGHRAPQGGRAGLGAPLADLDGRVGDALHLGRPATPARARLNTNTISHSTFS